MPEGFKTGNPFIDATDLVQGFEAMASSTGGGPDWTEAMREADANWRLCQRQAEDWMKAVGRQMAPGGESDTLDGIAEETLRRMLDPTTELPLPGGHVGVCVSSKSRGMVGDTVFDWLIERQ